MKESLLLYLFIMSTGMLVHAQNKSKPIQDFELQTESVVTLHRATGTPAFIKVPAFQVLPLSGSSISAKTESFVRSYGQIFGVANILEEMVLESKKGDAQGFEHVTYQQYYRGVPIYDGKLKFHYDHQKQLRSINGVFIPDINLNVNPILSANEAATVALELVVQQVGSLRRPLQVMKTGLYIFRKGLAQGVVGENHLVYRVEVSNQLSVREFLFIDAHKGFLVEQFTGTHGALFRKLSEGHIDSVIWEEGDIYPGMLDIWQQNELEAAAHTYHLFFNTFGYDSYDGAGAEMHTFNNSPFVKCPNASWNGSVASYCTGTAADDVVAHEWGHAYTEYTSGLIYQWQAGALNESYSDIWGETVDLLNGYEDEGEDLSLRTGCSSSQRWRMGEDAIAFGGAIRDMWNPTCQFDAGKVSDPEYKCWSGDNGGVHSNSGVNNHAYALLVDGGTFNGQTITGIGLTKAAHIFWRSQSEYLTATSDFSVQADALEVACADLIGIDLEGLSTTSTPLGPSGKIISMADLTEVQKVIEAVEFRLVPDCGFIPILAPAPVLCIYAQPDSTIFYEDFESGLSAWTLDTVPSNPDDWEARGWAIATDLPNNRLGSAAFGIDPVNGNCTSDLQNGIIALESPLISVPGSVTADVEMAFDHYLSMENTWDGGNIKYKLDGGAWILLPASAFSINAYNDNLRTVAQGNDNPLAGEPAFTGSDGGSVSGSWGTSVLNITSLGVIGGSDLQLRFEVGTDGCNGRIGWYLDDIRIYSCGDCNDNLVLAETRDSQDILFEVATYINSGDTISGDARIIYSAGQSVDFSSGFEISLGAEVEAVIEGCSMPALSTEETSHSPQNLQSLQPTSDRINPKPLQMDLRYKIKPGK